MLIYVNNFTSNIKYWKVYCYMRLTVVKRMFIAITGLPFAGKTSFIHRLLTGRYSEFTPTIGVDVEFVEYLGYPLQVFDLAGHEAFRKRIWKNYVKQSHALIFIFDASDLSKINESAKWFWQCIEWTENRKIPVLFLANKKDLIDDVDERIEQIVSAFNLEKLSRDRERSFRFFFVSVKTGENIPEAMNWLIIKQFAEKKNLIPEIITVDFFVKGQDCTVHIHDNVSARSKYMNIINSYIERWEKLVPSSVQIIEEIEQNNNRVIFIREKNVATLIITPEQNFDKGIFLKIMDLLEKALEKQEGIDGLPSHGEKAIELLNIIKSQLNSIFLSHIAQQLVMQLNIFKA